MKLLVFLSVLLGLIKEAQKIHIFSLTKVGKDTVRRDECKPCAWGGRGEIISNSAFHFHNTFILLCQWSNDIKLETLGYTAYYKI